MGLIILTTFFFSIVVAAMAVGYIFQGKCLAGSCGGRAIYDSEGEMLNCETCPVRKQPETDSAVS